MPGTFLGSEDNTGNKKVVGPPSMKFIYLVVKQIEDKYIIKKKNPIMRSAVTAIK